MEKFIPQFQPIVKEEWAKAVYDQIMSGWIGAGATVELFEEKIRKITNTDYAIATTSGTTAIMLAIHALNIPKDKIILFPAYTFLAGANAARFMGYNVELIDINAQTLCMDVDALKYRLRQGRSFADNGDHYSDVGCVMFVNHNGYVGPDVQNIKSVCVNEYIHMIEDSSQALGMQDAGTVGDIGIFSFSVPKIVSTGQGGVMFTNIDRYARRACEMRDHGDNWRKTKLHDKIGINLKFDDIHAAYGLAQLNDLDYLLKERARIYARYKENLIVGSSADKYSILGGDEHSGWMVILRPRSSNASVAQVPRILEVLAKNNIQATQYYRPIANNLPYKTYTNTYSSADRAYANLLYLPSSLSLTNEEIDKICTIIKSA